MRLNALVSPGRVTLPKHKVSARGKKGKGGMSGPSLGVPYVGS